jgi:peroxin-19
MGGLNDMLKQLFEGNASDADDDDDAFGAMMKEMQKHIQTEMHAQHAESGTDVDRTISKLMEDMASMGNAEDDDLAGDPRMMEEMMKEFEKMRGDLNADDMIDGMMGQLLSKDLMYEPMKQVTELFPGWLQDNKSKLSEDDFSK